MKKPRVLILYATGTNRDMDLAAAFTLAGADPEIVPLNLLKDGRKNWQDYQILALPGGFSYADALGAGKLLAIDLNSYFSTQINEFIAKGKAVIGICNGFQALVKSGILPGNIDNASTLTFNQAGHFECRWVAVRPQSNKCIWTRGLQSIIQCPVSHGEGNFKIKADNGLQTLVENDQVALVYSFSDGSPANQQYPENPNGSSLDIAGICNFSGNILGLMPHPENHIYAYQNPQWTRNVQPFSGLPLFINGVNYASQL